MVSDNESKRPVDILTGRDLVSLSILLFDKATDEGNIANKRRMKLKIPNIPYVLKSTFLAKNIVIPNPILISNYVDLIYASLIMKGNRISGLPVVNSDNKLCGTTTKTDIVKFMVK